MMRKGPKTLALVIGLVFCLWILGCDRGGGGDAAAPKIPADATCAVCKQAITPGGGVANKQPDGTAIYFCSSRHEQEYLMAQSSGQKPGAKKRGSRR